MENRGNDSSLSLSDILARTDYEVAAGQVIVRDLSSTTSTLASLLPVAQSLSSSEPGIISSSLCDKLASTRRTVDGVIAHRRVLEAGTSSISTLAPPLTSARNSSTSAPAGTFRWWECENSIQRHFGGGNVNASTAVGSSKSTVTYRASGGASAAVQEMESSAQGDSHSFQISHEQLREQTNVASLLYGTPRNRWLRARGMSVIAAFRLYAAHMYTFRNPPDKVRRIIGAAIQIHLKSRKYQQPVSPTDVPVEDEQYCCICLGEYVDGEDVGQLKYCIHEFHYECISQWLLRKNCCPVCKRTALKINSYAPLRKDS